MQSLSAEAFGRAKEYLMASGRPLEQARFKHLFESGSLDEVATALAAYQNPDGGYGHALEPDAFTPTSGALATSIGLRVLRETGATADHKQVRGAVGYLLATLEPEEKVWRIIPADANDYPHAPWWTDENDSLRQGFGAYEVNPRAELVGQLHACATLVPADLLDDLTERTIAVIEAGEQEEHALICAVRLAETMELPARYRDRLAPRVRELVKQTAALDPATWSDYGPQPLWYVSAPDSLCVADLADATQTNLDFLIAQQAEDGSWKPTFNWGGMYPDDAPKSERDSTSVLTYSALAQLRAFGRIESVSA
jgi:hypothetical protein